MINNRKYSAARRALDPNSSFRRASQAMANAITALQPHPADRNRKLIACPIYPSRPVRACVPRLPDNSSFRARLR